MVVVIRVSCTSSTVPLVAQCSHVRRHSRPIPPLAPDSSVSPCASPSLPIPYPLPLFPTLDPPLPPSIVVPLATVVPSSTVVHIRRITVVTIRWPTLHGFRPVPPLVLGKLPAAPPWVGPFSTTDETINGPTVIVYMMLDQNKKRREERSTIATR